MTDPTDGIPAVPSHARNRWTQRSSLPTLSVEQAWFESIPVGLPDECPFGPRARLHDPGDVVLIYDRADEPNRDFVIKTVLHRPLLGGEYPLHDDHLLTCETCARPVDPARSPDGDCHWCEQGYAPAQPAEEVEP